jgi:large exoprotein involved in heme utilization and adhesion
MNGAGIIASTRGEGDAGKVVIRATDSILLDGESTQGSGSGVFSTVDSVAQGNSGGVEIESGSLSLMNGAGIIASTLGEGDAGKVVIRATDNVFLDGEDSQGIPSAVASQVDSEAKGNSRGVEIESGSLSVTNGAVIDASTFGEGDAGKVVIRATDSILLDGESTQGFISAVFSTVESGAKGNSGGVEIESGSLSLMNGAQISAQTQSTGMAGDVRLNVTDFIQLSGNSVIRANATVGGPAGDLTIETGRITLDNGAEITVSSPSGQAGDLTITADSLFLNQGRILAETATSDAAGGANINLNGLELLLLENESLISANALEDANGGNVTIDARFIVATPPTGPNGSDITANAVRGNGGRVSVTTQGLFGIEFRDQLTPDNDITVSSEFGIAGNFELNQLGIDPSQGLIELPSSLVDASGQIVRRCGVAGNQNRGEFIVTGRGGLPISPDEPISSESVLVDLGNGVIGEHVETLHATSGETGGNLVSSQSPIRQIIEAQGWVRLPDGTIVLTANPPTVTSPLAEQPTDFCQNHSPSP